ncbi:hypothetical protein KIPB_016748, partial [Kipferlia bialata]|eukprot:g16748.t1
MSLIERYTIKSVLGEGSFGVVIKAERDGCTYACKLVDPNSK